MLEVRERDFGSFYETPFHAYDDPSYVSYLRSDLARILDEDRNPLFRGRDRFTYFTVLSGNGPLGRIVCHIHEASNLRHGLRRGYFGFFDCVDDPEVSGLLLSKAEDWARRKSCDEIAGNFNLTAMQQIGVVTEGFGNDPYTDMQYNPEHVPRLLRAAGFEPFFPMSTFELPLRDIDPDNLLSERNRPLLDAPELRWAPLRRRHFTGQMESVRSLLNASFDRNPMFVPLTSEEFLFQAKEMMWIIDERLSKLVFRGNEPVGAIICIPDLNPLLRSVRSRLGPTLPFHYIRHLRNRRRAVIIFWAVDPSMWGRGLNGVMLHAVTASLRAAGYSELGLTWIADVNTASLKQTERLGAKRLHRLQLFRKPID
ncbi:MAG TPA: GNAT family N-acetyltransferase [Longimicrobiales bacterium]|nr:GNAT family N-acetyltransferase [Longimicrobiales bacterium]